MYTRQKTPEPIDSRNLVPEGARLSPSDLQEFLLSGTENRKIYVLLRPRIFNVKHKHFKRKSPFKMLRERQFCYILQNIADFDVRYIDRNPRYLIGTVMHENSETSDF